MIQIYRLTIWLAASWTLLASARLASAGHANDLLGLTFLGETGNGEQQQQQQQQQVGPEEAIKRELYLKELDLDDSLYPRSLSKKELRRRARLNELLDAISARALMTPADMVALRRPLSLIHRSGRTPPSHASLSSENYRNFRQIPMSPISAGDQLKSNERLLKEAVEQLEPGLWRHEARKSGALKSLKSPILGIVWPHDRSSGTPPFYSDPLGASATRHQRKISEADERDSAAAALGSQSNQDRAKAQRQRSATVSHRAGSEEVALHTPIRAQSESDYEWKREEQSRWNNLRGMWGKRAASKLSDESLAERFKNLLEAESQPDTSSAGRQVNESSREAEQAASADDEGQPASIGGAM